MYWQVRELKYLGGHTLWVRFEDSLEGRLTFSSAAFRGCYDRLRDEVEFAKAEIRDSAVMWPGDTDIAPDAMYDEIKAHGEWVIG